MPKPTRKQIREHKALLRRQKVYENKYRKKFYSYLRSVNYAVAKSIDENGLGVVPELNSERLERIYRSLYKEVTLNEAEIQFKAFGDPRTKDIIDALTGIFASGEDVPIRMWRNLLNDFLTVRIAGRITEVQQTTRERIAVLIERGIAEGLGAREVATTIRKDRGYNRNRSLAIARTETITAANQGKFMAALSSPFEKEKKWLPTNDARTRLSHRDFLDRPFVSLTQPFFVANSMGFLEEAQYPCASTLSASNVCNCRCIIVFRNKLDENGNPIRKRNF